MKIVSENYSQEYMILQTSTEILMLLFNQLTN